MEPAKPHSKAIVTGHLPPNISPIWETIGLRTTVKIAIAWLSQLLAFSPSKNVWIEFARRPAPTKATIWTKYAKLMDYEWC